MRFALSLLLAVAVSLLLFTLMYRLISPGSGEMARQTPPAIVDIRRVKEPPKQQRQKPQQQKPEPSIKPLALAPIAGIPVARVEPKIDVNDIHFDNPELNIQQKYWSQPATGSGSQYDYVGEMDTGQKELVPVATSRPNIPKTAYENRINGWVLLAFAVTNDGHVTDIRIMDANPRGVFEANAIAAVRKWVYQPYSGPVRYVSQRIGFEWKMYVYNMDID